MRILHNRKAVSPVIAVVLLIALVVAAAAVIWGITTGLLTSNSKLIVDNYDFLDLDNNKMIDKIVMNIRNLGSEDAVVSQLLITANDYPFLTWQLLTIETISPGSNGLVSMITLDPGQQLTAADTVILTLTTDGNEVLQEIIEIPTAFNLNAIGEIGSVSVGGTEITVTLNATFIDPVVVAVPVANSSAVVRSGTNATQYPIITAVTSNSFKIVQVGSPADTDGVTVSDVNYIVMEKGIHYIRSMKVYVGSATVVGSGTTITYTENFTTSPSLIASTQTNNNAALPRVRGKSTYFNNATLTLEDGDNSNPGVSFVETVGYIIFEPESDLTSGIQSYTTIDAITHIWYTIPYNIQYLSAPIVVAFLDREDGGDSSYIAITEVGTANFKIAVEETTARDGAHTTETASWVAMNAGIIYGTT